jgi:molybdenum cofactor synthesis domain-containing protein
MSFSVALVVASDKAARGERADLCVAAMRLALPGEFSIASEAIVEDDYAALQTLLKKLSDVDRVDCIIVSGGTGLGPRDVTPQATHAVIDYEIPGIGEAMRAAHAARIPTAILSRSLAGVRKHTLIIAVPGSPNGARESLAVIAGILPHALGLLRGEIGEHSVDVKSTASKSTAT